MDKQKTALVTGASRGIGFGIACALMNDGYKVAINARSFDNFNGSADFIKIKGDVSNTLESSIVVNLALEKLGKIDLIVCNVGSGISAIPGEEIYYDWHKSFAQNFFSTTNVIEAAREHLKSSNSSIICISSICGIEYIKGAPTTYSVAKSALNFYIKLTAKNLAPYGVKLNGLALGNILFDGSVWQKKIEKDSNVVKKYINENVPTRTLGDISDVTNAVLYLSNKNSKFISGAIMTIDGGQTRT